MRVEEEEEEELEEALQKIARTDFHSVLGCTGDDD